MTFIVEHMTQEIVNKILNDLNCNMQTKSRFTNLNVFKDYQGMRWAVDHQSNTYLFKNTTYPHELGSAYDFYFDSKFYVICFEITGSPNKIIKIDQGLSYDAQIPEKFKQALTEAFAVYGVRGYGAFNNKTKKPALDLAVLPIFSDEVLK